MTTPPPILARHNGYCPICETTIVAEEDLIVKVDGDWQHADCCEVDE